MDVLSSVIQLLRLEGHSYGRLTLGAPFALSLPDEVGHFVIVIEGRCRLKGSTLSPLTLTAGDFVFLPLKGSYSLLSADEAPAFTTRPFSENEQRGYAESGALVIPGNFADGADVILGCFRFGAGEQSILTEQLDGVLTFHTVGRATAHWTTAIFQMIVEESQPGRVGSFTIIDRLAEVLFIQALRARVEDRNRSSPSWLRALRDPAIGRSIREMHFDVGKRWSVDQLARLAGMSRSGFAARFRDLVGRGPMDHLAHWRMLKAARILADGDVSIGHVAAAVGYSSEGAFRRRFLDVVGVSPGLYRRTGTPELSLSAE